MVFTFDVLHDSSTFIFHVTISIDPTTNAWRCSVVCGSSDVQADVENINIPDGTYLPIHSAFSCIRDKVYSRVHDMIVDDANFGPTMQTFLANFLNNIPTSVNLAGGITFNFAPTALVFADATGGLALGFSGTVTFGNAPSLGNDIVVPLPTPDPAHTAAIRVATLELQMLLIGLYGAGQLNRRYDASSVPEHSFFNTNNYQSVAAPFYQWAPSAEIVLYVTPDLPPTLPNIQGVWVLTEDALANAGITPQSDPDAYGRLEPLVQARSIYADLATFNYALQYQLTPQEYAKYQTGLDGTAATNALPVTSASTARVCVITPNGTEREAFVATRNSTFQCATFGVDTVMSAQTGEHLLTFAFDEASSANATKSCAVPGMTDDQISLVLNMLMMGVDKAVQDVGKQGIPIPTVQGFAIQKASANFTPSSDPGPGPVLDAIIDVVADLTVDPKAWLWQAPERLFAGASAGA